MEKQNYSWVASSPGPFSGGKISKSGARFRAIPKAGAVLTAMVAITGLVNHGAAQAQVQNTLPRLAQSYDIVPPLPEGAVPVPGASLPQAPVSGEQYVVFVSGDSPRLLEQVQIVEPTAFRTTIQGRGVIQAGRFNLAPNAQQRVRDLQAQGFGAEMAQVSAAVPYYAQTPALPANVYATTGDLPPLPVDTLPSAQGGTGLPPVSSTLSPTATLPPITSTSMTSSEPPMASLPPAASLPPMAAPIQVSQGPTNVEFGEALTNSAPPLPDIYPVDAPPFGSAIPDASVSNPVSAPYYVVIPTSQENLAVLSSQVIQLGTPADRVQQRTAPRGPHVAIGPFDNRGLANRWNDFYREAGIPNSRVFFNP